MERGEYDRGISAVVMWRELIRLRRHYSTGDGNFDMNQFILGIM